MTDPEPFLGDLAGPGPFRLGRVARAMGFSERRLRGLVKRHGCAHRDGRCIVFSRADVLRLWEKLECPPEPERAATPERRRGRHRDGPSLEEQRDALLEIVRSRLSGRRGQVVPLPARGR